MSRGKSETGRGSTCARSGKFSTAELPLMLKAATSCARAAISGVENVPSQMRDFLRGSRISDTHLPQLRIRTPRYTACLLLSLLLLLLLLLLSSQLQSISLAFLLGAAVVVVVLFGKDWELGLFLDDELDELEGEDGDDEEVDEFVLELVASELFDSVIVIKEYCTQRPNCEDVR